MLSKILAGAVLAAAFSTAVLATEVPVQKGAEAASRAAPDDVICTYEDQLGSHFKHRVCATRATREESARKDRAAVESLQRKGEAQRGGM